MRDADVVIVGAGHGGAQVAIALRQMGYAGSVRLIGREPEFPYERPPLSKDYLAREKAFERLLIRPPRFWTERAIDLTLDAEVVSVDPTRKRVALRGGDEISYGTLIWSAGGDPRRLECSGAHLRGVHHVRTRADVDRLMAELDGGARRIVVVGGGYIGLEAAAVLSKLGCAVTLFEAGPRLLGRVAGEELSRFFLAEHRRHGVHIELGEGVDAIEGDDRVRSVRTRGGVSVPAEAVVVGIGIAPCVAPLLAAGAVGQDGVLVDDFCRTSLPDIYAIGDCAAHRNAYAGGATIRLESVQNANDMAATVARAICGDPAPYAATPWFWSNQYDLKLQTVGLSRGHDRAIVRGDPADRSFSIVYLRQGQVVAIDSVNAVRDFVQGRRLVEANAEIAENLLAETNVPLKEMPIQ